MGAALSRSPLSDLTGDREDEALLDAAAGPHHDYGSTQRFQNAPTVTSLIKETRYCIINALDTSLTKDELGSLEIYLALLLPIVRTYREERHEYAAVYCFLLNRWQFLKEAEQDLANARLNETRADACEIVATKLLKAFSMRQLIEALTCDYAPIRRKDTRHRLLIPRMEGDVSTEPMSALEVAIEGKAKHFLNQLWLGNIVYFAQAIDEPETCINATQQEMRAVTLYDNRDIQFCRLSRLRVPRYKTTFQFVSLATFVAVYTYVMFAKVRELNTMEVIMNIFAVSYGLDEFSQLLDTGPGFYFVSVWNFLDLPLYCNFVIVLILRIVAGYTQSASLENFAFDLLACNSTLLWPRLFAALDHYRFFGTMMVVLRQMLIDCALWIALSLIFYIGFLQAFYALHDNTQAYGEISWLLLQVFLGSAFEGFDEADELGTFGRPLMVFFVAVSAVFLYTLLISIFSQTFSEVSANAKEEFMFLFSLKVMEEVKSDEIYEFQPPFNVMAGIIIWPSKWIFDQYKVGKINRALLRFFYFPELVCIWVYEMMILRKQPQYLPTRPTARPGSTFPPTHSIGVDSTYGTLNHANGRLPFPPPLSQQAPQSSYPPEGSYAVQSSALGNIEDDGAVGPSSSSLDRQQGNLGGAQALPAQQTHLGGGGGDDDGMVNHEVLSPSLESIRRFRDNNQAASSRQSTPSSTSSMLSNGLQRVANGAAANGGTHGMAGNPSGPAVVPRPGPPTAGAGIGGAGVGVATVPGVPVVPPGTTATPAPPSTTTGSGPSEYAVPYYSYYPMYDAQHPLRGGSGYHHHPARQQSVSGYGHLQFGAMRRRQGTEATLASTFQSGVWPLSASHHLGRGGGPTTGHGNNQFLLQGRGGGGMMEEPMSFRDGFLGMEGGGGRDDGAGGMIGGDLEDWLARMVDSRFDEMRERIEVMDQKLDAIMTALGISA